MSPRANKIPDAILTADWHLRDDQPTCRTDEFWTAQAAKMQFVKSTQKAYCGIPVIHAGDLLNKAQVSNKLLAWLINNLPRPFVTVPGNHDLINHSMALYNHSALAVLEAAGAIIVLNGSHRLHHMLLETKKLAERINIHGMNITGFEYGAELKDELAPFHGPQIAVIHEMILSENTPSMIEGYSVDQIRGILSKFDIVLAGHNHVALFDNEAEPLVLNPGPLTRQAADKADYEPTIWLWYADENRVEPIRVPHEKGVVSREHIDAPAERDERMEAFVSRLRNDIEIGFSFKDNIEQFMKKNKTEKPVSDLVWEAIK